MDDGGGDIVPALPIRTRVTQSAGPTIFSQTGLVLTTPDNSKVGTLKKWSDYTPINLPPTPAGANSLNLPTASPMPPRSPAQYYDQTPTPMDLSYYQGGAVGFGMPNTVGGFNVPSMQGGIQNGSTLQMPMQPQVMQQVQQIPYQVDASQQMMYMQTSMGQQMMQPQGAAPVAMAQAPGQQMVMMGMMPSDGQQMVQMIAQDLEPVFQQPNLNEMDEGRRNQNAGLQLFQEAFSDDTFDVDKVNDPMVLVGHIGPLPSPGSSTHATGRCQPCAWFHKPKGCLNAVNCSYCHLCPEGELKQRKKAKVVAMRMGALEPSQPGGSPPQIKLAQMLD